MAKGHIQASIGIDLGSTSVRTGLFDFQNDTMIAYKVKPVPYYFNPESIYWKYTQSSNQILTSINECLKELNISNYDIKSCGVAATCSMALFAQQDNTLVPWNVEAREKNVVFWMDSTAIDGADQINQLSKPEICDFMGGSFVPEMAIPKLKHLINIIQKEGINVNIEAIDLHRYIAWSLAEKYGWNYQEVCNKPNLNGIGHDGELAGWTPEFYKDILRLPSNVIIGPREPRCIPNKLSPHVTSSIDCYSNWFALLTRNLENSLFIVGGTSTCYLYASNTFHHSVTGVWGPFSNIINDSDDFFVYEAGQSCTGKLIEHLFKSHPATSQIDAKKWPQLFREIEASICTIENETKCSIHWQTKHMFFYGDLEGNRTPYADPKMSGMFIGETTDISFKNLVYKYICILEFITFQIKHMINIFTELKKKPDINEINFCGGQAKNQRLLHLIKLVNKNVMINLPSIDASLMGVYGSFFMGKASSMKKSIIDIVHTKSSKYCPTSKNDRLLSKLLNAKYDVYLDMAKRQKKYRNQVDEAISDFVTCNN